MTTFTSLPDSLTEVDVIIAGGKIPRFITRYPY
jgi:hypothetical protein